MKFKPGDRVVQTIDYAISKKGWVGTIVKHDGHSSLYTSVQFDEIIPRFLPVKFEDLELYRESTKTRKKKESSSWGF
jgi:hypothetical protein